MSDLGPCSHFPIWAQDAATLIDVALIAFGLFAFCAGVAVVLKWRRRDSRPPLEAAIHRALTRKDERNE